MRSAAGRNQDRKIRYLGLPRPEESATTAILCSAVRRATCCGLPDPQESRALAGCTPRSDILADLTLWITRCGGCSREMRRGRGCMLTHLNPSFAEICEAVEVRGDAMTSVSEVTD